MEKEVYFYWNKMNSKYYIFIPDLIEDEDKIVRIKGYIYDGAEEVWYNGWYSFLKTNFVEIKDISKRKYIEKLFSDGIKIK